ncbi:MAG: hypothetical protein K5849_04075 [Bacteroidales bacterium]|nr:hypothetical protein [Bacteroidales bacterium]
MVQKNQKRLILCAVLLLSVLPLSAQVADGQTDSLVRLLNARYIEQVETDGKMARKAIEATFLHNGTYLSCDTAFWHVEEKIINCFGNVQLMQGESVLTSEKLDYLVDENLAQFRGAVVQLRNKQDNILRTKILDYNTQDSLAVFLGGASMMSEDGQIIESDEGTYSNALNFFTFTGNVNMFTDSVFVRTNRLEYDSDLARADFLADIDFWKEENMLSAGGGWYERNRELFFFRDHVHGLGRTQESWSDSLYYYRSPNDVQMLGNVQVQDQSRKVAAMGDRLEYVDSLSRVTLQNRASSALWEEKEDGQRDTTYLGATRFVYHTLKKCDISEEEVKTAAGRLEEMLGDPVAEYRRRAAQQAADAAAEALKNDPNAGPRGRGAAGRNNPRQSIQEPGQGASRPVGDVPEPQEEPPVPEETPAPPADSLNVPAADSLAVAPPDTSKIGFLLATGDVRIFRKDMQVRCDSLRYSDLDSIARLYKDPIVWNEGNRQYNSDSLFVLVRDNKMDRANLLSNAFIHVEEKGGYYDQIKSTDVIAYFNDATELERFDALGGVNALFYLEENDEIATVNKVETSMMMATFKEGEVQHVYNFDHPKNDAYPVVQLPQADQKIRGFNWQPERRPKDKFDVTSMVVKDSEREAYESRPRTEFPQTELYFPGHMAGVYKSLNEAKALKRSDDGPVDDTPPDQPLPAALDSLDRPVRDSLGIPALHDTLDRPVRDSLSVAPQDAPADTTMMSDRELKRAMRTARRDARWAELDARDAEKASRKEARKEARKARREAKRIAREARQTALDAAKLQKYIERYTQQKERNERKQKPEPAGERPPGTETGGELPPVVESE